MQCLILRRTPGYSAFDVANPTGTPEVLGNYDAIHLNTTIQSASACRVVTHGVILYEPFGGLYVALDAVLRNDIRVHRCDYSDLFCPPKQVAEFRIQQVTQQNPHQLPRSVVAHWAALPMDVP